MKKQLHIFLTGPIQVGKSTVIRRYLAERGLTPGGFCTVPGMKRQDGCSDVFLTGPDGCGPFSGNNRVLHRTFVGITVFPEIFDTLGPALLTNTGDAGLILMDELGTFEKNALRFQTAVMGCLDGEIPVLGVVQDRPSAFLDRVRVHPKVMVIPIDCENRNNVLTWLLEQERFQVS